jgi:hypothetical protein
MTSKIIQSIKSIASLNEAEEKAFLSILEGQNVGTTLRNDEFSYLNKNTKKTETLKAPTIGIANSPIIFNIAIGYTFGGK